MPLLPPLAAALASNPPGGVPDLSDLPRLRAQLASETDALAAATALSPLEVGSVDDVRIHVSEGEIRLKIYRPVGDGPHPVHLYIHGGGWILGSIDERFVDVACRERTALGGFVTVSVDYRLAPEHPFPIPLDDCYASLLWIADHIGRYSGDPDRITIGGGSAGGNLAAAVTLRSRDEGGPRVIFQLLEIPALDLSQPSALNDLYGDGSVPLSAAEGDAYRALYVPDVADRSHAYASPLLADDLTGVAPALVMSAEFDILQDDGRRYAERLRQAGVPAEFSLGDGQIHGSYQFTAMLPESLAWRDHAIARLRAHAFPADPTPQHLTPSGRLEGEPA